MNIPYSELPNTSKVLIFQSDKEINEKELFLIQKDIDNFSRNWLTQGVVVIHLRYLIILYVFSLMNPHIRLVVVLLILWLI